MLTCSFCGRECKNRNSLAQHSRLCSFNPKRVEHPRGYLGKVGWNKGLTKLTHSSINKASETLKKQFNEGREYTGCCDPTFVGSEEHREMSRRGGGYREGSGRSKKFLVKDSFGKKVCLQSSYELEFSRKLDELSIRWVRPSFLRYDNKKYFPDFYLVDYDVYIDTKNDFLIRKDATKISAVNAQNGVDIRVLSKYDIEKYAGESEKRGAQPITVLQ